MSELPNDAIDTEETVEEADKESFPASDAPAFTTVTRILIRDEPPKPTEEAP